MEEVKENCTNLRTSSARWWGGDGVQVKRVKEGRGQRVTPMWGSCACRKGCSRGRCDARVGELHVQEGVQQGPVPGAW